MAGSRRSASSEDRKGVDDAARRLSRGLSSYPWVEAVFRNGSTVVGTDQRESDVDFTVIVRTKSDRAKALAVLRRKFTFLGLDHGVPSFAGRRRLCITILDRRAVERLLRSLYRSKERFLELQGVVQHKVVEAVAVHDPGRLLARYQARAAAYPRRIQRAVFSSSLSSLRTAFDGWGARNEFQYAFELPALLENVCLALYARNRQLFMLPFKRLPRDLRELEPDLEAEVHRLVRCGRSAATRAEGRRALGRIVQRLTAERP